MVPLRSSELLEQKRALRRQMQARREALSAGRAAGAVRGGVRAVARAAEGREASQGRASQDMSPSEASWIRRLRWPSFARPGGQDCVAPGHGSLPDAAASSVVEAGDMLMAGRFGIPEPDGFSR